MNYLKIKMEQPTLEKVFFAFSNKQFAENKIKAGIGPEEKIYRGPAGSYGTKEGLLNMVNFYDNKHEKIKNNCDPQEVYDYEFNNHECSYVYDDEEAINIVIDYFGEDRAKQVKRRYANKEI